MNVYTLDPITDPRWEGFVESHPSSSIFHTVPWLETIRRTYGYKPIVYTTTPPSSPLTNGIAFCEVKSWLTGRRLVSLPFSDHCEPLLDSWDTMVAIVRELNETVDRGKWKYVEIRPARESQVPDGAVKTPACFLHMLDLRLAVNDLLRQTHKSCIQRPIKRAESEGIRYEHGRTDRMIDEFYGLLILTRRRHRLPPQPIEWFKNLAVSLGDRMKIRVAYKDEEPIASILTLVHKNTIVYKYGCSDSRFNNLGATPYLFWQAILEAKDAGMTVMDFGRSDADNEGLVTFKSRWGAKPSEMTYFRWSKDHRQGAATGHTSGVTKRLFAMMPDSVLETTGRILYRHIG